MMFSNWTFMRFLRLGLGLAVLVQAAMAKDLLFAGLGLLFVAMPVFNVGCCSAAGCDVPPRKQTEKKEDVRYEELV